VKRTADRPNKVLTWFDLKLAGNQREPTINEVRANISDLEMEKYIDFAPYLNTGVIAIPLHFFLKDAYTIFRTMALTHLIVVNHKNQLLGVITRKDLLGENIMLKRKRQQNRFTHRIRSAFTGKKEKRSSVEFKKEKRSSVEFKKEKRISVEFKKKVERRLDDEEVV